MKGLGYGGRFLHVVEGILPEMSDGCRMRCKIREDEVD